MKVGGTLRAHPFRAWDAVTTLAHPVPRNDRGQSRQNFPTSKSDGIESRRRTEFETERGQDFIAQKINRKTLLRGIHG